MWLAKVLAPFRRQEPAPPPPELPPDRHVDQLQSEAMAVKDRAERALEARRLADGMTSTGNALRASRR